MAFDSEATPPYFKNGSEVRVPPPLGALARQGWRESSVVKSTMEDRGVAANGGYDAGRWGDYANAVAGKIGAVLFARCVAGVEGEGKDVETGMYAETSTRTERQNIEH